MNSKGKKLIDSLALILASIGALNWGILVVLDRELINGVFKLGQDIANMLYILIALAGIWCLFAILPKSMRK